MSVFTYQHARRFAYRLALVQGLFAVLPAPGIWILLGGKFALAFVAGGLATATGSALATWWAFGRGQQAPGISSLLVAEALKFTVVIVVVALAIVRWKLPFGALLLGLIVALVVHYLAGLKSSIATQDKELKD
ncbi:MAG: hypothetical protein DHS20C11_01790 [Lysobacteraceae bacterium]|nr:MAG: hypothetical protein DHS20C11_01790 [Xanthomonadaceae bacterium]